MPFTPFHAGPGALLKAAMPTRFSFLIFCFAQFVTDCETAYHMLRGQYPLHRWLHTFAGATLVAVFCVVVGRPVCHLLIPPMQKLSEGVLRRLWDGPQRISLSSAISGAFLGTYSHVLLDSIVHPDAVPFRPFSGRNPFYGLIGWTTMEWFCITAGWLGALWIVVRLRRRRQ